MSDEHRARRAELVREIARRFPLEANDDFPRFRDAFPSFAKQVLGEAAEHFDAWSSKNPSDPLFMRADLLSPLGEARTETIHTQALAYLLDPSEAHGVEDRFLRGILATLEVDLTAEDLKATILAERPIEGGRIDLWIELEPAGHLIVIENKIDAPLGDGQLQRYEEAARVAAARSRTLVLLAPDPEEHETRKGWRELRYDDVALALRRALDGTTLERSMFATLYLTTILRELVELRASENMSRAAKSRAWARYAKALEET